MIEPFLESQKETKFITEIVESTVDTTTKFELLLEKSVQSLENVNPGK